MFQFVVTKGEVAARWILGMILSLHSSMLSITRAVRLPNNRTCVPKPKVRTLKRTWQRRNYAVEPFLLADIGEGIAEVEVLRWFVEEGAEVKEFDKICLVQSDKATVDISSPIEGKVTKLHHKIGDMARVGQPLIDVDKVGEATPAKPQTGSTAKAAPPKAKTSATTDDYTHNEIQTSRGPLKVLATPAVRHMAALHKLPLNQIKGTGKAGRILKVCVGIKPS